MTKIYITFFMLLLSMNVYSQNISGNFSIEAQTYKADSTIGAQSVDEQILSNAFLNLIYRNENFEFGIRYENYMNPLLGYDQRFQGQGIAYRYGKYLNDFLEITAGDFYEQYGSGLILRAYEERALGLDNAIDGINFRINPIRGILLSGLIGKQRYFWNKGDGIVRGGNIDLELNEIFEDIITKDLLINLGASVVSRFQNEYDPTLKLPENVLSYSGRAGIVYNKFSIDLEYAYKYNDPNSTNKYNYNSGQGLIITSSYSTSGFGLLLSAHKLDNMDFRSDRNARANDLTINYIPPLTKQHVYALAAIYPYATKANGEAGIQSELTFKLPSGTILGGEYGTPININFSIVKSIDTTRIDKFTYDSPFFGIGDRIYFQDFNIDITRRITDNLKIGLTYLNQIYDKDIVENEGAPFYGKVNSNILIFDGTYNLTDNQAIRLELQHLWSKQDSTLKDLDFQNGNWAHILVEYTIAPEWFFTFYDQYNYGNYFEQAQVHYTNFSVAYFRNSTRLQLSYGRQRGGIICVGGVCRAVPASNGLYFSLTSSF